MSCLDIRSRFLKFMEECGALLIGDFTLKSGRKSPYFVNTGEYKTGRQISRLGDFYAEMIKESGEKFDVLFGPAYKGIPLAVITASKLSEDGIDVSVSFDRKERKDHGEGSYIMGHTPKDGDRIAIIEDVTSAGTSIRETRALIENLGINAKITALFISIDRAEKGTGDLSATEQIKKEFGINVYSIATANDIIGYLENVSTIQNASQYAAKMREYLKEYGV